MNELIKVRLVAFAYEVLALFTTAFLAAINSSEFSALITEHWGSSIVGSLLLLGINALVKHMRNLKIMREWEKVGGSFSTISRPNII